MDHWETGRGAIYQTDELSCTYCGSLHPDRFMELARAGWSLTPTDKAYKVYLGPPMSQAEKDRRKKIWRREWRGVAFTTCREDTQKPTPAEVEAQLEKLWREHGEMATWSAAGMEYKFYFPHLSVDQRREFVDLYNDQALVIGYPGYFYTLPYFCVEVDHDPGTRGKETRQS